MYKYPGKNYRPFTAVCDCKFGRKVIYTKQSKITQDNIITELRKALAIHDQNAAEIDYLDRYYRGDQPILYRQKENRPEVNNKVTINLAFEIVERKTANICAEPIQYVLRSTEVDKAEQVSELNAIMDSESKQECDIRICRWRSICGTAYRFIGNDEGNGGLMDESDFELRSEDPRYTFVAYHTNERPAFSCQIRDDADGHKSYFVYTKDEWMEIVGGEIVRSGLNGNDAIPVIEYPNNERRLSDLEIVMPIMEAVNTLSSDRINGVEQFVSSWVKFVNCEVDEETFKKMRQAGALVVKSNNGSENKADVDLLTQELNQSESQVVFNDMYDKILEVSGLANRQAKSTGGDTGNAVELRNGHYDSELRTAINEPILKKSENMTLRIVLNRLRIRKKYTLVPSDIEIHINHNKLDNMLTKSQALQALLACGIDEKIAIKTIDLFSDPERVYIASKDRMEVLYPREKEAEPQAGEPQEGQRNGQQAGQTGQEGGVGDDV